METLEGVLSSHPFFATLPPRYLAILVGCASNVRFDGGQFIHRAGEEANEFYLLRAGKIALELTAPGRPPLIIQTLSAGEILGWSWLVPPYHWSFDARAVESTRAIALDGRCMRTKCEADHELGYELLKRFAHIMDTRLQATRLQLLDIYGKRN